MKLAIMQPYLFPYIGYYKLIKEADRFVFLDDVNFKKKGWINRNKILFGGEVNYFVVPLSGASQNKLIYEIEMMHDNAWRKKLEKSICQYYSKAKYFKEVYSLISPVFFGEFTTVGEMAKYSIRQVLNYLSISTELIETSRIYKNSSIKGEGRIIDICRLESADNYINLPGGKQIYSYSNFLDHGINLAFVDVKITAYQHFSTNFEPGLSIIDVLMHNSPTEVLEMLK